MAYPIEHFENIEDPEVREDELHREIERLSDVLDHLKNGTASLEDVANPGGMGKALEDGLENVRDHAQRAVENADRAVESLGMRLTVLREMRDEALDELDGEA